MISVLPPTAAIRRSGPWDLEKLRMWMTWSGSHAPRLTSLVAAISPEWSSSMMMASLAWRLRITTRAISSARAFVSDRPVGFWPAAAG